MPKPRSTQISLEDTPFYHCVSRTVRKAFLCGVDKYTNQSFEHRREWVESRLLQLEKIFSIDIAAYVVMSNHLHLVLRIDADKVAQWSGLEVVLRWHQLFKGTFLTQKFARGDAMPSYELETLNDTIAEYRRRLMNISWFMRTLNEPIARQANKEDKCTGRFWEGRFKSQALLDEAAVLACMAYVDLNPIRAKMSETPECSDYTSIQRRIKAAINGKQPKELLPFVGNERLQMPKGITFSAQDYLTLVDDTGRLVREGKRGAISASSENILKRLQIPLENWLKITNEFTTIFKGPVGTLDELKLYSEHLHKQRVSYASCCQHWQI